MIYIIKIILYKYPTLLDLAYRSWYYSGYCVYIVKNFFNLSYIGGYLFSQQELFRGRKKIIKKILEKLNNKKVKFVNVLEIGVYAGQNTLFIAKILKEININFYITCLDPWRSYNTVHHKSFNFYYKKFNDGLDYGKVLNLLKYNLKSISIEKKVKVIKKESKLFFLKNKQMFDLIFIDGSHNYKDVLFDIKYSKKFLKNGGIIVGDDYEVKFSDVHSNALKNLSKNHKELSFQSKQGRSFHPGVTKAVYRYFGNINPIKGLFVVKKNNRKFLPYQLNT
jgi:predicted O-methyltransferase YrrM